LSGSVRAMKREGPESVLKGARRIPGPAQTTSGAVRPLKGEGPETVFSAFLNFAGHARTKSGQVRPLHMKVAISNILSTNYVWHIFSLLKLEISTKGREITVEPKIVMEIAFSEIVESPEYETGYSLRFPVVKNIRKDKGPMDADTVERLLSMYHTGN